MAKLKLHRCSWTFVHSDHEACWKVQHALDEMAARVRASSLPTGSPDVARTD